GDRAIERDLLHLLAGLEIENVETLVQRTDVNAAPGHNRRRIDTPAGDEVPGALAGLPVNRVDALVAAWGDNKILGCRSGREELLRVTRRRELPQHFLLRQIDRLHVVRHVADIQLIADHGGTRGGLAG